MSDLAWRVEEEGQEAPSSFVSGGRKLTYLVIELRLVVHCLDVGGHWTPIGDVPEVEKVTVAMVMLVGS